MLPLEAAREEVSDDTQRGCECCAEVPDTSHWVLVEPVVSIENGILIHSLNSDAGSYECSLSSLRWSCGSKVTLRYHFMDWGIFSRELNMQYCPVGPLMNIKLKKKDEQLKEIHLPHFLCLGGGEASARDALKILHGHDSGVCVEVCELTRHHARIVHPSLSPLVVVWRAVENLLFKAHCELLLFYNSTAHLKLHVYLVPKSRTHIEAIKQKEEEETPKGVKINKPGQVGPLRLDASVCVTTSCQSEIQPKSMHLLPFSTSNYCEVYIRHPDSDFNIVVISSSENGEQICKRTIYRDDFQLYMASRGGSSQCVSKYMVGDEHFIEKHRTELILRVTNVDYILDHLLERNVISQEKYNEILCKPTRQAKMREILAHGNIHGSSEGKDILYEALLKEEPFLMKELKQMPVKGSYIVDQEPGYSLTVRHVLIAVLAYMCLLLLTFFLVKSP